jgi:polar amino acid transport system substrate-binding protein
LLKRLYISRPLLALLGALILGSALPGTSVAQDCNLRVGWTLYPPFQMGSDTGEPKGVDIDILRLFLREADCRADEYRKAPWARVLRDVESGRVDMAVSASYSDERNQYAYYSVPYRTVRYAAYVSDSSPLAGTTVPVDQLLASQPIIGVIRDSYLPGPIAHYVEAAETEGRLITVSSYKKIFNLLKRGRISMFFVEIADETLSVRQMSTDDTSAVVEIKGLVDNIHFIYSRASVSPETVQRLDSALARVVGTSQYNAVFQQYMKP